MDQTVFEEEIESPVHRRRRGGAALLAQGIEDVIGADRLMSGPNQFEDAATDLREADAVVAAYDRRPVEGLIDAPVVVMIGAKEWSFDGGSACHGPSCIVREKIDII